MKYVYLLQTLILVSWVFLGSVVTSKMNINELFAEVVIFICCTTLGLFLALCLPTLWAKQKSLKEKGSK